MGTVAADLLDRSSFPIRLSINSEELNYCLGYDERLFIEKKSHENLDELNVDQFRSGGSNTELSLLEFR